MNVVRVEVTKHGAPGLEVIGMSKRFGSLKALDDVNLKVQAGTIHALLGGNGAGKSTLVKCVMGFYRADTGDIVLGPKQVAVHDPREARELGMGMVYQHFTLVQNMTVLENLVLSRGKVPGVIKWGQERQEVEHFMATTPFKLSTSAKISSLSAGEKQKLEILKQLYLNTKLLFLDEPTSSLTPGETEEVLGMLQAMVKRGDLTIVLITHRFREVMRFADACTILRNGKYAGSGLVGELDQQQMSDWMIGSDQVIQTASRKELPFGAVKLELRELQAMDDTGVPALEKLSLSVRGGEIVGIAGVSGNGQRALIEVIAGQRPLAGGDIMVRDQRYRGTRREIQSHRLNCLPEEPLHNTCVGHMSVTKNMAMRKFDQKPNRIFGFFLHNGRLRRNALDLIKRYNVKTPSPESPIRNLSGGNIQRAVLARELCEPSEVLITANPCYGLDFHATADIRSQIMEARNHGAAVLLISEDLDEILELSDRIFVIFEGQLIYETSAAAADISLIGRAMAGHPVAEELVHA
jgi:simple sugar transport system ATP-binding protein